MSASSKDVCDAAYVMDAAGFFAGLQLTILDKVYTVMDVLKEVKDRASRRALEMGISAGKIVLERYGREDVEAAKAAAERLGELGRLSETDIKILALTHALLKKCKEVIVLSDDRSVQNVALELGAKVVGIKRPELRSPRKYVYVCPSCGRVFDRPGKCPYCGVELKRKRVGKGKSAISRGDAPQQ